MKQIVLYMFRLAMIIAPAYSIYVFMTGEGAEDNGGMSLDTAGFIAWALGAYLLLIWASMSRAISWGQITVLCIGGLALMYFFLSRDIYSVFLAIPFFEENKKLLPIIPYAMTMITLMISFLFRRKYKKS